MKKVILILCLCITYSFSNVLQEAINNASAYDILEIPKGIYEGNIVIDKALTLKASEAGVVIKGEKKGSVITIKSSYVTIDGLTIKDSGKIKQNFDSAILANNVKQLEISNNKIKSTYIGIAFNDVSDSKISNNTILGNKKNIVERGDAISMFGGQNNTISSNTIRKKRDIIVDGSYNNKIINNNIKNMRYAIHGMNASGNLFENNKIDDAIAGLYFMYNKNYIVKNNTIKRSKGTKGIGIGLIESYNFEIKDNNLIYNTIGILIDASPEDIKSKNIIKNNSLLYNSEGVRFKEILINSAVVMGKNYFIDNIFSENISDVIDESTGKELSTEAIWKGNYWDNYKGLDENNDGVGDIPYSLYYFSDVIWMTRTEAKFFFGSIGMSLKDFIGKIIPTRQPYLMLTDLKPRIKKER